jgi:hypothetical protein
MLSSTACPDNSGKSRLAGKTLLQTLFCFLLVTQICFAQWVQVGLEDKVIKDIAARNSNIFVITSDSGSVYRSTDNGSNWTVIVDTGAIDIAIAPSGTVFLIKEVPFLGYFTNHLFSSADNGATWDTLTVEEQIIPPPWSRIPIPMNVSVSHTGIVYCGIKIGSGEKEWHTFIASSIDDGITWTTPGLNLMGGHLFDYKGESVISAGFDLTLDAIRSGWNDVYLSTDNGTSWIDLGLAPLFVGSCHVLSLCLNGNMLLGGSDTYSAGLFLSGDSCTTWTQVSTLIPQSGLSIETGGTLVGTDSLGVFLFNDDGDSLGSRNDGLANLNIHTLTIDNNNYVYAGTDNGVWRRSLSDITSVEEEQFDEIPTEFSLSQNYPNPFNPSTRIKYQVSSNSFVSLVVYDILGNEIETLVNEEKSVGIYKITWNAASMPSGVYFYHLKAGEFTSVKKMILLK